MSTLQVSLLGPIHVIHDGSPSGAEVTRSIQGLLAYLLLHRHRSHPREKLAGLFWGDQSEKRARNCLNTALWRLRQVLEPEGIPRETYLLTTSAGEVGFNSESDYWLDVEAFEDISGQVLAKSVQAMGAADAQVLEHSAQLYTGDLLEGFYADWALRERERLRRHYLNCLAHLMYYYQHHSKFEESLASGQRILDMDPLREEIHREMMRLYLENGQRALAVRQYETCREILGAELGIPPMEETQALYTQIMAGASQGRPRSVPPEELISCQWVLQRLHLAMQSFDEAREDLQRAIQLIEGFIER